MSILNDLKDTITTDVSKQFPNCIISLNKRLASAETRNILMILERSVTFLYL